MGVFDLLSLLQAGDGNSGYTKWLAKNGFAGKFQFDVGQNLEGAVGTHAENWYGLNYKMVIDPFVLLGSWTGTPATSLLQKLIGIMGTSGCLNWYVGRYHQATYGEKLEIRRGPNLQRVCASWIRTQDEAADLGKSVVSAFNAAQWQAMKLPADKKNECAWIRAVAAEADKELWSVVKALLIVMGVGCLIMDGLLLALSDVGGDAFDDTVQILMDCTLMLNNLLMDLINSLELSSTWAQWAAKRVLEAQFHAQPLGLVGNELLYDIVTNRALSDVDASVELTAWMAAVLALAGAALVAVAAYEVYEATQARHAAHSANAATSANASS